MNFWWHRITGKMIRVVRMDGCMAHVRGLVREGVIVGFVNKSFANEPHKTERWVRIKLTTGEVIDRITWPGLWNQNRDDGVWEYIE